MPIMEAVKLHDESIQAISQQLAAQFEAKGLVLVHKDTLDNLYQNQAKNQERERILAKQWVTVREIKKYSLLPNVKSEQTIRNMVEDGRIPKRFVYHDKSGVLNIATVFLRNR